MYKLNKRSTLVMVLLLISLNHLLWAKGNTEQTPAPAEELSTQVEQTASTPLLYTSTFSDSGMLHKFYEEAPLPENAVSATLRIYEIEHNVIVQDYHMPITNPSIPFEYIIADSKADTPFFPLQPLVAALEVYDASGTILYSNTLTFTVDFTLSDIFKNGTVYQSLPFVFNRADAISTHNIPVGDTLSFEKNDTFSLTTLTFPLFHTFYGNSDTEISNYILTQVTQSIKAYNADKKFILITGFSAQDDYLNFSYQRVLNKVRVIKQLLVQHDDIYDNIPIYIDIVLRTSTPALPTSEKEQHFPLEDQFIVSVTKDIDNIALLQRAHELQSKDFYTQTSMHIADEYNKIYYTTYAAKLNVQKAVSDYLQSLSYFDVTNFENLITRATRLENQINTWTVDIQSKRTALKEIRAQLLQSDKNAKDYSIRKVLDDVYTIESIDQTIMNQLLKFPKDYEQTYRTLVSLEKKYTDDYSQMAFYQDALQGYMTLFKDYQIKEKTIEERIKTEENITLLDKTSSYVQKIESQSEKIISVFHRNVKNNVKLDQKVATFDEGLGLINTQEQEISEISLDLEKNQLYPERTSFFPIQIGILTQLENVSNGTQNISLISQQLYEKNILKTDVQTQYAIITNITQKFDALETSAFAIIDPSYSPKVSTNLSLSTKKSETLTASKIDTDQKKNALQYFHYAPSHTKDNSGSTLLTPLQNTKRTEKTPDYFEPSNTNTSAFRIIDQESIAGNTRVSNPSILGDSSLTTASIEKYIHSKQGDPLVDVSTIIALYEEEAKKEGVNMSLAIAQMLHTTKMLSEKIFFQNNNPVGLGTKAVRWKIYPFYNLKTGIRAHIQHLKAYASNKDLNNEVVDPRFQIVVESNKRGTVKNLSQLANNWYEGYSQTTQIARIHQEMNQYSP